jgi:hypothetical protein
LEANCAEHDETTDTSGGMREEDYSSVQNLKMAIILINGAFI